MPFAFFAFFAGAARGQKEAISLGFLMGLHIAGEIH
jgi:hypothetical protein